MACAALVLAAALTGVLTVALRGNLWAAIVAHAGIDTISLGLTQVLKRAGELG